LGDAVGRIEGDTLVVETVNVTDETWLTDNGAFHTKALRVVERVTVLHEGRVLKEGTPAEIEGDAEVQAIYMGGR
jgi:ABC-type branched-subunit amino acid transport system ATPase component